MGRVIDAQTFSEVKRTLRRKNIRQAAALHRLGRYNVGLIRKSDNYVDYRLLVDQESQKRWKRKKDQANFNALQKDDQPFDRGLESCTADLPLAPSKPSFWQKLRNLI